MRRIALLAGMALSCVLPAPASAGELYDGCRETEAALVLQGPCRGAEQVLSAGAAHCRFVTGNDEACAVPLTRRVVRRRIADHERSNLHRILTFQQRLGDGLPFTQAFWPGTHNSANSVKQRPALSETDANQQLSLTDQLRLDIRSLELDVHSFRGQPVLCHGQGEGIGCTTERTFAEGLDEISDWLDEHPREVLLLYIEDHVNAKHEARVRDLLVRRVPTLLTEDRKFAALTRDDVLDAGKQVVAVGGSGSTWAWKSIVFQWAPFEWEDRPHGFTGCANAGAPAPPYAERLVRFYEDSTWLTAQAEPAGQSSTDDGLRADTVRAMLRCGVDLFGFDQLVPDDERLSALAWSFALDQDPRDAACAVRRPDDGRWLASDCSGSRPAACRATDGSWLLTGPVTAAEAAAACAGIGGTFAAPRVARENAAIAAADPVWVGI